MSNALKTRIPNNYAYRVVGRVTTNGDGSTLAGFRAFDAVANDKLTQGEAGEKFGCSQSAISQRIKLYQQHTGNTEAIDYRRPNRKLNAMTRRQNQMVEELKRLEQVLAKRRAKLDAGPYDERIHEGVLELERRIEAFERRMICAGIKTPNPVAA